MDQSVKRIMKLNSTGAVKVQGQSHHLSDEARDS